MKKTGGLELTKYEGVDSVYCVLELFSVLDFSCVLYEYISLSPWTAGGGFYFLGCGGGGIMFCNFESQLMKFYMSLFLHAFRL